MFEVKGIDLDLIKITDQWQEPEMLPPLDPGTNYRRNFTLLPGQEFLRYDGRRCCTDTRNISAIHDACGRAGLWVEQVDYRQMVRQIDRQVGLEDIDDLYAYL